MLSETAWLFKERDDATAMAHHAMASKTFFDIDINFEFVLRPELGQGRKSFRHMQETLNSCQEQGRTLSKLNMHTMEHSGLHFPAFTNC